MAIWTLEVMRQEVRKISGRPSESQMTTADLDRYINEYYTLIMPVDLELEEVQEFWTKDTEAGVETVTLDTGVLFIKPPVTVGGYPLKLVDDPVRFYQLYPKSGEPYSQNRPEVALNYGRDLILAPPPDAVYEIHAPCVAAPGELGEGEGPLRDLWGRLICLGTAILIYGSAGQRDNVEALAPAYETQRILAQRPYLKRMACYRGQPRF